MWVTDCETDKRMNSRHVIGADQIQVWIADLALQSQDFFREHLSPSEKIRADKFHFQKDRDAYEKARGILRFLLGRYLNLPPADVQISTTKLGKPYISELLNGHALSFNLSHSGGVAVYAFALNHPVGVDVETLRPIPDLDQLAARFFTENERKSLQAIEPGARTKPFLQYWTRKEAYLKAIGLGLSISPEEVNAASLPIPSPQLTSFHPQIKSDQNIWSLMDFYPTNETVAAVVVASSVRQVSMMSF
jgi:4'-phosphopantetheinyl transferase